MFCRSSASVSFQSPDFWVVSDLLLSFFWGTMTVLDLVFICCPFGEHIIPWLSLSLSSVFCCRACSGYPNGYPVLGNSRGGFPLPSSRFVITYCGQSFPSPWHCLSTAPSLSGATLLSTVEGVPLSATWDAGGHCSAPAICQSLTLADPIHPLAHHV